MQLDTLQIFCDLVETRSFTLTARRHSMSQPAVSQRIQKLEEDLQARLVDRGGGPIVPTRAGQVLYEGCRATLRTWNGALERVRALKTGVHSVVRIGTIYSVGLYELPELIKGFIRDNPGCKVHLEYVRDSRVYQALVEDALDLGIVAWPRLHGDLAVRSFRKDRLVVAAAPDHPLVQGSEVPVEALDGQRMIGFEGDIPTRRAIDEHLERWGVSVEIVSEYDNIETIKRVIELGSAFSILPEPTLVREVAAGTLVGRPLRGVGFLRDLGVVYRRSRPLGDAAGRLLDVLSAEG
ncbi:LysR family transcriptional regulator [Myxococcota bacterium]|nr:LysR family transcriptional regulator [Myxococcota bacterium]